MSAEKALLRVGLTGPLRQAGPYSRVVAGNLLGEYLRARRQRLQPEDVGFPARTGRRVTGLRREEVASLAGISADYYQRLEQGRDSNPSAQVMNALVRILRLDAAAANYLFTLAGLPPRADTINQLEGEQVPAGTLRLLAALPLPAIVVGRYFDVLASNASARALSPALWPGRNRLLSVFLDAAEFDRYGDWELSTAQLAAVIRAHVGTHADDLRFQRLIERLSMDSERFRTLWEEQEVTDRDDSPAHLYYEQVGDLTLDREQLAVTGATDQSLVIYHAPPGSPAAAALQQLLRTQSADTTPDRPSPVAEPHR